MAPPKISIQDRFWRYADRRGPDECWPWTGVLNWKGYGRLKIDGVNRSVPQIAWEVGNNQPFPRGMFACHTCDNPRCVNPAHIWPGTPTENYADSVHKGRRQGHDAISSCPNCGCDLSSFIGRNARYPAPQGRYAKWKVTKAARAYSCHDCGHEIHAGELTAGGRCWSINGQSLGGQRFFRVCAPCAGLINTSRREAA